jgi:hypothetical protein
MGYYQQDGAQSIKGDGIVTGMPGWLLRAIKKVAKSCALPLMDIFAGAGYRRQSSGAFSSV